MVAPCPWNAAISWPVRALTWSGSRARNSGRKPPINASRSSAGAVRSRRIVPPGGSFLVAPRAFFQRQVATADEVVVSNDRSVALGQHHRIIGTEFDQRSGVISDLDVVDLADLDAGDTHEVAGLQPGHVGEDCVVGLLFLETAAARRSRSTRTHRARTPRQKTARRNRSPVRLRRKAFTFLSGAGYV